MLKFYDVIAASFFKPAVVELKARTIGERLSLNSADFRHAKPIGMDINEDDEQLRFSHGYDHNFCLDGEGYREVAGLYSEMSGIGMEVYTDLPGIQLYTGNGITEEDGKCLFRYKYRMGVALETQFWPDAVNKENFPGGILKAGEKFVSRTTYKFV